jgi:hypothetical protein
MNDHQSHGAAVAAILALDPELSRKQASAEAVNAISPHLALAPLRIAKR